MCGNSHLSIGESYSELLGQILLQLEVPENADVYQLKTLLEHKKLEIADWLIHSKEEYESFKRQMAQLEVQTTEARDLLAAEMGVEKIENSENCPYKYVREFYIASIEELQNEISILKGGKNKLEENIQIDATKDIEAMKKRRDADSAKEEIKKMRKENSELQEQCNILVLFS